MKKPQFVENEIYHIYNRGVEKRKTFLDREDHLRFIHDLFEFNDEALTTNVLYYFDLKSMEVQPRYIQTERKPRKLLVELLIFELMPNHFHLLLRQKRKNGIIKFMQKLGTGYTMYFNKKYNRVGSLFQGRFKAVHVTSQAHLLHLPFYIHANPLLKKYRGSTSINWRQAMKFLESYRWSSFPDYIGKKNFPSLTQRSFILNEFGGEKMYKRQTEELLQEWVGTQQKLEDIDVVLLDHFE